MNSRRFQVVLITLFMVFFGMISTMIAFLLGVENAKSMGEFVYMITFPFDGVIIAWMGVNTWEKVERVRKDGKEKEDARFK